MSEHTPGPWNVEKTDGYVVCELTAGWCVVATEADPNKYSPEADARLIAAAPRMKKTLERIHEMCLKDRDAEDLLEIIRIEAVKAMREAKGEQG